MTISSGEEDSDTSMAASSASTNWWNSLSLSSLMCREAAPHPPPTPLPMTSSSNWNEEDNLSNSFTNNTSDNSNSNSSLSLVSQDPLVESCGSLSLMQMDSNSTAASDNHLWNQVLLGGNEGVQHMEENVYDVISSRGLIRTSELLQQSDDLVRKTENEEPPPCWEFSNLSSFQGEDLTLSNIQKQSMIPFSLHQMEDHRSDSSNNYAISDMRNWCPTPPEHTQQRLIQSDLSNQCSIPADYILRSGLEFPITNYELGMRLKQQCRININDGVCPPVTHEAFNNMEELQTRMKSLKNYSMNTAGDIGRPCYTGTVLAVEGYNFNPFRWQFSNLNRPALDFSVTKTQSQHHPRTTGNVHCRDFNNGVNTKRRTTDTICHDAIFKRPRAENSSLASKVHVQVPKVKLGDRITALQQLVSPFGKTDTASVLLEAIGYIKFLHEQVQVLSAPYMNSKVACQADHKCWVQCDMKKKETKEGKQDLKSKGLCLVPLSCTLQVSNDNTNSNTIGGDYWRPSLGDSIGYR